MGGGGGGGGVGGVVTRGDDQVVIYKYKIIISDSDNHCKVDGRVVK